MFFEIATSNNGWCPDVVDLGDFGACQAALWQPINQYVLAMSGTLASDADWSLAAAISRARTTSTAAFITEIASRTSSRPTRRGARDARVWAYSGGLCIACVRRSECES